MERNDLYRSIKHSGGAYWACSPDGSLLAAPDGSPPDLKINIWNIDKNEVIGRLPQSVHAIHLAFTTDGKRLLAGSTIWSVESFEDIFDLPAGGGTPAFAAKIARLEQDWRAKLDPVQP